MTERYFFDHSDLRLADLEAVCSRRTSPADYPSAQEIRQNIVIYDGQTVRSAAASPVSARALQSELHACLKDGPGVLVVRGAWSDLATLDAATAVFQQIIRQEATQAAHRGDHFAAPGENERIWNALQKFCEQDADRFIDYYNNPVLALICEAWLGPGYQVTSQINVVKPGGSAQQAHRDYHLGFQDDTVVRRFPASVQVASQFLTLQGAVAHTDMSVKSGPTRLLPYSQQYTAGYLAWRQPEFIDYFEHHSVQLPLNKGDAVFFSPALFHAAGANSEATDRIANLLQVSVAFGRTMESVDWSAIARHVYPLLLRRVTEGEADLDSLRWLSGSIADGYSFPTNLDADPPVDGCAPEPPQQLLFRALELRWTSEQFAAELATLHQRRQP